MGHDEIEHGDVLDPVVHEALERNKDRLPRDRELDGRERWLLSQGKMLDGVGNGSAPSFADLDKATLDHYRAKAVRARQLNAAEKKLAEQAAYFEKHKEYAGTILGGKLAMIEGLLEELIDPQTKKPNTARMNEKRLGLLQSLLNDWEKAGALTPSKDASKQTLDVNVTHTVSQILDRLGDGK